MPECLVLPSSRKGANRAGVDSNPKGIGRPECSAIASTGRPPVRRGVYDGVAIRAQNIGQYREMICYIVNRTGQ